MARKKKQASQTKQKQKTVQKNSNLAGEVMGILLIALSLLLAAFLYFSYHAPLAEWMRALIFGLFGIGGYIVPLAVAGLGVACIINIELPRRSIWTACGFFWLLMAFVELCAPRIFAASALGYFPYLGQCFSNGKILVGGGVFGGILSYPIERLLGKVCGLILLGTGMVLIAMLVTHFSIRDAASLLGNKIKDASAAAAAARMERAQYRDHSIKESAKEVEEIYQESFPEEEVLPQEQEEEQTAVRRSLHREEEREKQRKQREAAQARNKQQEELSVEKTERPIEELNLLNQDYKETLPAADPDNAERIQLYPADGEKGKFKRAGKLRPRREYRKKSNRHDIILPPKVKDPVQRQLAEDYYYSTGLQPKKQVEPEVQTELPLQEEQISEVAPMTEEQPASAAEYGLRDRSYFGEEDVETAQTGFEAEELPFEEADAEEENHSALQGERGVSREVQQNKEAQQAVPEKKPYLLPKRLDLLDDAVKSDYGVRMEKENLSKALILEQALKSFNIDIKVNNIVTGPTVTRYELLPAPGVKVSKILSLSNDIALNLAAPSIRIEAPIPGKPAIGIEVPNREVAMVKIKELLDTDEFRNHKSNLYFALGKDITGKNIYGDLAKMPHLLVAGTTGSGKSVCINSIIMSILYRSSPEEVNLVMVDPKVVEMKRFNGIPHMKMNVVTDPKKATSMLNWVVTEMEQRYRDLANANVKEIDSYNLYLQQKGEKIMPKLVVIIDELADLMMASKHEVEDAICRIAQLGRAAGIHLVVATQTPRADVITGMIKTNISSRIALTVSSGLDSRIILDMNGAEDLIGHGDMLFMPIGRPKPVRLQGCYISDAENDRVIDFLKKSNYETQNDAELEKKLEEGIPSNSAAAASEESAPSSEFDDELIPEAAKLALEYEQLSSSMLMRRLKVGYARAARLVDQLELMEVVSPADGNKPRQLLITQEDYRRIFGKEDE